VATYGHRFWEALISRKKKPAPTAKAPEKAWQRLYDAIDKLPEPEPRPIPKSKVYEAGCSACSWKSIEKSTKRQAQRDADEHSMAQATSPETHVSDVVEREVESRVVFLKTEASEAEIQRRGAKAFEAICRLADIDPKMAAELGKRNINALSKLIRSRLG
jgi:hypothetical protein